MPTQATPTETETTTLTEDELYYAEYIRAQSALDIMYSAIRDGDVE